MSSPGKIQFTGPNNITRNKNADLQAGALYNDAVEAALADGDMQSALAQHEFLALFDSAAFMALLDDDSVRNAFMSTELIGVL